MYPLCAPIALAAMIIPSMTECGSPSSTERSMKAPGSPSSALQTMYLTGSFCAAANDHLRPVGKPAPPRPRKPESLTSLTISSGVISKSALRSALYPPAPSYSAIDSGSMKPQLRSTMRTWGPWRGASEPPDAPPGSRRSATCSSSTPPPRMSSR